MALSGSENLETQLNALDEAEELAENELIAAWSELAKNSYHDFYEFMNRDENDGQGYVMSPHQRLIGDLLMAAEAKETMRFMLSMPPGHCKSTHSSHHFPAWYFGRNPRNKFLQAGHSQDFVANELGATVRALIDSDSFRACFPSIKVRADMRAKDYWGLSNKKGKYVAKGVGQGISGFRGNMGMVDDPFKSRAAAESATIRDATFKWYADDFSTRLLPKSPLGIIMCLTGGTQVSMADGSRKRLDAVVAGDHVLTWHNGAYARREVTKSSRQGIDEIFAVRTNSGLIEGNTRHPFLVQRNDGVEWVRLGDLQVGDEIVTAARNISQTGEDLSIDEAWALGFMFGDGWVTKNIKRNKDPRRPGQRRNPTASWVTCVADCPAYPDRHRRCMEILEAKFGAKFVFKTRERYWRTEKASLGRWLYGLGLSNGAKGKRIPALIHNQTAAIREAFLAGFMGADGCVERRGSYGVQAALLANEELVTDLRHLARHLGYRVTNICHSGSMRKPPNSKEEAYYEDWGFKYHFEKEPVEGFTTSTVRSIKPAGVAMVYDITVDGDECFIADGHVVHNTRWHSDDICGRIGDRTEREDREAFEAAQEALKDINAEKTGNRATYRFEVINLPAIAEEDDVLGRQLGEPLWPELFDLDALANLRSDMTAASWNSLYQGTPMDIEGGAVKSEWFQRYDNLPTKGDKETQSEIRRCVLSVDAANTAKERSDFTVITVWIEDRHKKHYLADVYRKQVELTELSTAIDTLTARWRNIAGSVDAILVEAKGNGLAYIQLKQIGGGPAPIIPIEVGTNSKEFRFDKVTPMFESGQVFMPNRALWLADYEKELIGFPHAKHDDQVDSTSQYLEWSRSKTRRGTKKASGAGYGGN